MQNFLRLCRSQHFLQNNRFTRIRAANVAENNESTAKIKDFSALLKKYRDKITFSSYLEHEKLTLGNFKFHLKNIKIAKRDQAASFEMKTLPPLPVSLQYFVDKSKLLTEEKETDAPVPEKAFQLPFANKTPVEIADNLDTDHENKIMDENYSNASEFDRSDIDKWMANYECFDDSKLLQEDDDSDQDEVQSDWNKYYGKPDPTAPVSRVQCGGCGALLHCSDPAIPGYLPSEIFKNCETSDLQKTECQRCHFLKEYNIALDVNVQPEEYEKLLKSIRHIKSLVLVMVDLLDFPCSIWPGIVDIIGTERPIILVANKVDLLPGDSIGYLKRIKESLMTEINKTKLGEANIKYVSLISAKTGYGVEDLISAMFKLWMYKGDVFLVGCTNVGKSSLFNALLQSDYCKVHAVDIVKRATVSRWPGTTLNLLKFPINRPSGWKIYARTHRLKSEAKLAQREKELRNAQLRGTASREGSALIGHIGRSFSVDVDDSQDYGEKKMLVLDERHKLFARSKWLYDTPGVVHPDQILSLLSTEELLATVPKQLIRPQTYYLHGGSTIFIGGLARVDFLECPEPCRFTVFCSNGLPVTITQTADADLVYERFVGTELFAAPVGGPERLKHWPMLKKCEETFEFIGEGPKACCGDVVLSSAGWVAVTAKRGSACRVVAWTPEGRGVHRRHPSVLPYAVNLKGKRIEDTPAYMIGNVFSE